MQLKKLIREVCRQRKQLEILQRDQYITEIENKFKKQNKTIRQQKKRDFQMRSNLQAHQDTLSNNICL